MSWEMARLGDVCVRIVDGSHNPPQAQKQYTKYMMLSSKNILDGEVTTVQPRYLSEKHYIQEHARTQVCAGDVLLTIVGTIGRVALICDNWEEYPTFQRSVAVLRPKEDLLSSFFLMYSLRCIRENLEKEAQGNSQKGLYLNQIENITIPLPALDEQRRIVAEIERQLTAVERAKQAAEEQLAAASKLNEAYLREVFANIKGEQAKLGAVCNEDKSMIDGKSSSIPYLGLEMIEAETGRIDWTASTVKGISACYFFDSRHILYGKLRPYLNKVALPEIEGRCSTEIIPLLPKPNVCREYIAYLLRRKETVDYIMPENSGSRMPRADMDHLLNMSIPLPHLGEQRRIVEYFKKQSSKADRVLTAIQTQLDTINAMSAAIMRQAFCGNI